MSTLAPSLVMETQPDAQRQLVPAEALHDTRPKKGINRGAKGAKLELVAIKILEADGYKVHRCVRTGAKRGNLWISQNNDVFGCVDLIAKKRGERTRWVQVTADGGIGRKKDDLAEVPWDTLFDSVEIWRWVPAKRSKTARDGGKYFQVYHLDTEFVLDAERRIQVEG